MDIKKPTAMEAVKSRLHSGSETVEGVETYQARQLWHLWSAFKAVCVNKCLLEPVWVELIFEDFVLYGGQHAGGRDGTAPERVAYAFEGYRHGRFDTHRREKHLTPIFWQMSGQASQYKKRPRLEAADAWIRGREHERSAFSHMILRVNSLMSGKPGRTR